MAVRFSQRLNDTTQYLANQWDGSQNTDTVLISIYDLDDNAADLSNTAMTNETGGLFSYTWSPVEEHTYRIDYYNQTLDSHDIEFVRISTYVSV